MSLIKKQAVIIGGGPGGLAAAAELKKKGIDDLLILEREHWLGGILRQCIHDGFGLSRFGCSPLRAGIRRTFCGGSQKAWNPGGDGHHRDRPGFLTGLSPRFPEKVWRGYQAEAVILAMGCRGTDPGRPGHSRRASFRGFYRRNRPGL